MGFTISGKVCAVTGGASGIGLCFVNRLLEHGAQVRSLFRVIKIFCILWFWFGEKSNRYTVKTELGE